MSYGAAPVEARDRTPPNRAIYVDPSGDDTNPGSIDRPLRTIQVAHDRHDAPIVLMEGTHRESVRQRTGKTLRIQCAPGERARLVGSLPAPAGYWYHDTVTGLWSLPVQPIDHTPNAPGLLDPARPWASSPEQVWFENLPLTMCDPAVRPDVGEFHVGDRRLTISDNPTGHDIRVATISTAITGAGTAPMHLYGLEIEEYATTSMHRAAVTVFAEGGTVEHCVIRGCSAAGLSMRGEGQTVINVDLVGNGQLGGHAWRAHGLALHRLHIGANNLKGFARIGEAGGWKLADTTNLTATEILLFDNNGHGLWADEGSDDARIARIVVKGGASSGVFFEMSDRALITGCHVTGCEIGILASASNDVEIGHNTTRDCGTPILIRADDRRRPPTTGHRWPGNDPGGRPATPSLRAAALLNLTLAETAEPHLGWYGPNTTPPLEEPMPYDLTPLTNARLAVVDADSALVDANEDLTDEVDRLIAELRRLEALILADDDDAVIAALQATVADLQTRLAAEKEKLRVQSIAYWNTAVALNTANDILATLNQTLTGMTAMLSTCEAERDTLEASLEEAHDLLTEAQQALAECEAGVELDPIIVGVSHQQGYPAAKTMLGGAPDGFRQFIGAARMTAGGLSTIQAVQADGCIPYVSVTKSTAAAAVADATFNADELVRVGAADLAGVIIIAHEPTQKMSAAEFKAMVTAQLPIYRDRLPNWRRVLVFMRQDFLESGTPRDPAAYLPDDLSLIDAIGVDLYDKGNATASGDGKTFAELMAPVEDFAILRNLQIDVCECSAPDQGQRPGNPPVSNPRRKDWKRDFTLDTWDHIVGSFLGDGRRLYRTWLAFCSTVGEDAPQAVPADPSATPPQPEVPAGWIYAATTSALQSLKDILAWSRALT